MTDVITGTTVVEFKAGKMAWDGKLVTPDKRKGKLQLVKDHEDLHHVLWWDRDKNEQIDDYVVVADAYVLKYLSSKVRVFFWMQEPKDDKDDELVKKFNDTIGAEIPAAAPVVPGTGAASSSSAAAPGAAVAAPAGSQAALQAQLLALLQNAGQQAQTRGPKVSLNSILKADVLLSLAEDAEALAELKTHMPADQKEDQDVVDTLHSPQLKENMKVLTQAIYSDQLPVLFSMLGLQGGPQMGEDMMESLCKALEQKHKQG
eukprot:g14815.t1